MIGGFFHTLQGTLIPPYDINKKSIFFVRKSLCISKKIITFAPRNKDNNIILYFHEFRNSPYLCSHKGTPAR